MSLDTTAKCPFCSRLYKVYSMTVADQSACPSCVAQAERNMKPKEDHIPRRLLEQFKDY